MSHHHLRSELEWIAPRLPFVIEGLNDYIKHVRTVDDAVFIELASDLSTAASYRLVARLAQLRPNEIWMVDDYTIRLWWD